MKLLLAALTLSFLGLATSFAQLYISASGGSPGSLTFTIHQAVTFNSIVNTSDAGLVLAIFDAYTSDQTVRGLFDTVTDASIMNLTTPATYGTGEGGGIPLMTGAVDSSSLIYGFSDAVSHSISIHDELVLTPGTFTFNAPGFPLPDNLENATLFLVNAGNGDLYSTSVANLIPEPATTGLLLLGGAALYLRRRPRR